jgi:Fe-S-cluster containining protein
MSHDADKPRPGGGPALFTDRQEDRSMTDHSTGPETLTATTELAIGSRKLKLKLVVPAGEVPPESLLPTLHQLSNHIVDGVEEKVERQADVEISCAKGCGACCRQHVPISPAEARLMHAIVENMPEPGRSEIRKRFDDSAGRLKESGILDQAMNYHRLAPEETKSMAIDYFRLGIACPFLQDESCSIHPFRPLICREYLVISSPGHCATLDEENIRRLKFPVSVASAFAGMDGVRTEGENRYIPLVMAMEWTEEHGGEIELRPGPKWVQAFFADLSGSEIPDPDQLTTGDEDNPDQ